MWVIFVYCAISPLTELLLSIHDLMRIQFYVFSGFTILEFTLFSFFFYTSLKERRLKIIPVIGALVFYGVALANFASESQDSFDSISASVEAILIISYCILLLYEQINDPTIMFVYNTKKFWVIIAFFLYFSSTLFLFIYARTFTQKEHDKYWTINNFFEILKNILLSISFIMKKSHNKPYEIEEEI